MRPGPLTTNGVIGLMRQGHQLRLYPSKSMGNLWHLSNLTYVTTKVAQRLLDKGIVAQGVSPGTFQLSQAWALEPTAPPKNLTNREKIDAIRTEICS